MSSEIDIKARKIFLNAIEKQDKAQLRAYLDQACGENEALRQRVDALLLANQNAGDFLNMPDKAIDQTMDRPSVGDSATRSLPESTDYIGSQIGPYKLLQEIGQGGMGTVYMAQQEQPVKRRVALKIIKQGMDTKQVVARFEAERQALSMMDHPNIAQVLDVGATEQGRPYFVMELIKGLPITSYCDENNLRIEQRLQLFQTVCNAVQHAHQKGIIHRDIKPSNVLIAEHDGDPIAKIIDFGLAKAMHQQLTEKTMFTQLGQVVGTLEYMSPEQSSMNQLEVDTRTDIYSLGVLLYELLTGTTPFDNKRMRSAALDQILKMIREEDPPKPSLRLSTAESSAEAASHRGVEAKRLGFMLRGDLDWIVMKALDKDRNRRYETANGFRMDVTRFLDGQPVVAAPPSTGYRLKKFVRRNKATLALASTVAFLFVIATFFSTWQAVRATQAESKAINEAEIARAVTAYFVKDILAQSSPNEEPDREIKLRTVLDRASEEIENGRFDEQPHVEIAIRATIGKSYAALGLYNLAERHLERSRDLCLDLWGPDDAKTLSAMNDLSIVYVLQNELDKAQRLKEKIVEVSRRVLGETPETAMRLNNLGDVYRMQLKIKLTEKMLIEALSIYNEFPQAPIEDKGKVIGNLGILYAVTNRANEAEKLFKQLILEWNSKDPLHPDTLRARYNLAYFYQLEGHYKKAEDVFANLVGDRLHVLTRNHVDYAETLSSRALNYLKLEDYTAAKQTLLEFLDICNGHEHLDDSWERFNGKSMLGEALAKLGEPVEAERLLVEGYQGMLDRQDTIPGDEKSRLLEGIQRIVSFYSAQGNTVEVNKWSERLKK